MFEDLVDAVTELGDVPPVDPLGDGGWAGIERVESVESVESGSTVESAAWLGAWGADLVGVGEDGLAAHALSMSAGSGLAEVLGRVDSSRLSPSGRLDFVRACERLAGWVSALPLGALVDHIGRDDVMRVLGDDGAHYRQRGEVAELAAVLTQSEDVTRDRIWVARELTGRLSDTGHALSAGRLSYWHARALVQAVAGLDDQSAGVVQTPVLAKAHGRTLTGFTRVCGAAVVAVDGDAIVRRHRQARADRQVRWWPNQDGMARLLVDAGAPEVQAMHAALRLLAGPRQADDPRTLGARMSDALLGLADHPGVLRGYGPIPAGQAREWLTQADTWARLVTDPVTGHLLDYGPTVRFAPHRLRRFVAARDQTCRFPNCRARADTAEIDHHPPWKPNGTGAHTNAAHTHALCAHHHLKTHGGWTIEHRNHGETLWRSPNGHLITSAVPPPLNPD